MSSRASVNSTFNAKEPIPGYVLTERIGLGGYGEVWKAIAPGGLEKAIKFVYGYVDAERAERELDALNRIKQVRHPFLMSLKRIEVVDGHLVIVTELADSSIKERYDECRESGHCGIPRDELFGYLNDTADALDYMCENHSLQHLDVKPENLLLLSGRVKIGDFGLVKDIRDANVSMIGGLTPVYAAPELFDGRPNPRSDQYSLAIVYQHIVSGVLPFCGRTAAQLAAQHLNSQPDVSPLPLEERAVILRALCKDSEHRFSSCRELVDCLMDPERARQRNLVGPLDPSTGTSTQSSITIVAPDESLANRTIDLDSAAQMPDKTPVPATDTLILQPEAARAITILPPVHLEADQHSLRPSLVIGIGGAATNILVKYRERCHARIGSDASLPCVQTLAVDVDVQSLQQATLRDSPGHLNMSDTIAVPLRTSAEYRYDCKSLIQSISRQWIYNVPRSLRTEGLRPLGRLALVDQSAQVWPRVRAALETIVDDDSLQATQEVLGVEMRNDYPRVFLLASISGGAGSGMLLDLAYGVRMLLSDLGLREDGVCGLLFHGSIRRSTTNDLAIANAFTCLQELNHYARPGSIFPADAACGLPEFYDTDPFRHTYFVNLGDDLDSEQLADSADMLTEYLALNTLSNSAPYFDAFRDEQPVSDSGRQQSKLRTCGRPSHLASDHNSKTDSTKEKTSNADNPLAALNIRSSMLEYCGGDVHTLISVKNQADQQALEVAPAGQQGSRAADQPWCTTHTSTTGYGSRLRISRCAPLPVT